MRMQDKAIDDLELPRNKVLAVFRNGDPNFQKKVIFQLFGIEIGYGDRIIKNLLWKTKYYQVEFDLYVDDYVYFSSWLKEFSSENYIALREVIAGLVVVDEYELANQLSDVDLQDSFIVWVTTNSNLDQRKVDEINDQHIRIHESTIELINLQANEDTNEYGEKVGVPRFKEIMDTCQWKNCELAILDTADRTTKSHGFSLELFIRRIQRARQKHTNGELDDEEAMQISEEIASELIKNEN